MSVVLITGSSTGIGQESALHLARQGHEVYASVRNPDGAQELKDKITAENLAIQVIKLDLVDPASIETAIAQILKDSGRLDAVVANAGIGAGSSVEETPMETVREIFETNYFGNVALFQAITPVMRQQGAGSIVVVGSLAGRYVAGCHAHYSASKWAVEGLCEALAQEMAEFGVSVSIVEPGCVATPMWTKVAPSDAPPLYPNTVGRLARFFEFGLQAPAMPLDVAVVVEQAITEDQPQFRYPVGKDAQEIVAARESVSENEWMAAMCLQGEDYYDKWLQLVGTDYYRE